MARAERFILEGILPLKEAGGEQKPKHKMTSDNICTFLEREGITPVSYSEQKYESFVEETLSNFSFEKENDLFEEFFRYLNVDKEKAEKGASKRYDYLVQTGIFDLERCLDYENLSKGITFVTQNLGDCNKILDLGCGDGLYSIWLAQEYSDVEIEGVDLSPISIKKARERAVRNNLLNITFNVGSFFDIPEPTENFDGVLAVKTIHETSKHGRGMQQGLYYDAFQRISAHLKPNGKAIVCFPTWLESHEMFKGTLPYMVKQHNLEIRDLETGVKGIEYSQEWKKNQTKDLFIIVYKGE